MGGDHTNGETAPLMGRSLPPIENWEVDWEDRKRHRLMLALSLGAILLSSVGALAVWKAHVRAVNLEANRSVNDAAKALKDLNAHLSTQSKLVPEGCEATILILRHCEKVGPFVTDNDGNEHCSLLGLQRAQFLATLFGNGQERWPAPAHLFALTPNRDDHWNFREWETLRPLSEKIGVSIDVSAQEQIRSQLFDLLRSGSLCGETAVISWKHEFISELAIELGCGPDSGCPDSYSDDTFDEVWQVQFAFHPPVLPHEDESDLVKNNETDRRRLHHKMPKAQRGWSVYATVVYQHFDPLAFKKVSAADGPPHNHRWLDEI